MNRILGSFGALSALVGLLVLGGSVPARGEDGVTDKEVVLGAGLDLTGAVANWGVNIKAGMEAVFNRVNDAGGVHGRKIRLISYDHVYQPPKAVTNAKRLVERDKVFAMMGHLGTPTTKAIKDYLEEKQVPDIFPATLASLWTTSLSVTPSSPRAGTLPPRTRRPTRDDRAPKLPRILFMGPLLSCALLMPEV
jgi:ABC-type branched-subunit amino acid transport system substrate-binding protein